MAVRRLSARAVGTCVLTIRVADGVAKERAMAIPEGRPREPMTSSQTECSPIEQPAIDELADVLSEAYGTDFGSSRRSS
ncbi:Hypothetical protein ERS075653_01931 [Mycobacteroides abscessus]|nr:Hypothetical protein ERS075653_01931 [Mycobacteroides abscessus]SIN39071.1 Uncharacterised protein [Mycobacteroides abscessus subsp. abscessus]SKX79665.1 Uncharacterised protein [Mycobacteroides abscessus subsp. abscessus]